MYKIDTNRTRRRVAYPLSRVDVSFGEGKRETAVESSGSTKAATGFDLLRQFPDLNPAARLGILPCEATV